MKNIVFVTFVIVGLSLATYAFSLGSGPIGHSLSSLFKRDNSLNTGGAEPSDDLLTIGYVTFPDDFITRYRSASSETEASTILYDEIKPLALKFIDVCYKTTNASAKAAVRTNTLGRILWIPTDDAKYEIDPVYQLDLPIKTACWERALNGDINKPVFDYSQQLLKEFHWDKAYAEAYLQEQHKRFKPVSSTSSMNRTSIFICRV